MEPTITSLRNEKILALRRLSRKRIRDEEAKCVVEGIRLLEEVVRAGVRLFEVFYGPRLLTSKRGQVLLDQMKARDVRCHFVSDRVIDAVSSTETPQGIIGVAARPGVTLSSLKFGDSPLIILAHRIADPGNLGTMIRIAHAAGADAFVATAGSADFTSEKAIRASMGSVFHIPVVGGVELDEAIRYLKANAVRMLAADPGRGREWFLEDYTGPLGLVVGSEAHGIEQSYLGLVDGSVRISMPGGADSLNAAVACGILAFEAVRQRLAKSEQASRPRGRLQGPEEYGGGRKK